MPKPNYVFQTIGLKALFSKLTERNYAMTTENIGEIVIAPRVLEVITGIAATKVDGVYALQN